MNFKHLNSTAIEVHVRIKPAIGDDSVNQLEIFENSTKISLKSKTYSFNKIHVESSQQDLFDEAKRFVDLFLGLNEQPRQNVSILTYGQTGSGKTYTIGLTANFPEDCGLIAKILEYIFQQPTTDGNFFISGCEIYNEAIYDLAYPGQSIPLVCRETATETVVPTLSEYIVETYNKAVELVQRFIKNRNTASTFSNRSSSRSHAVISLTYRNQVSEFKFSVIDLAGSERLFPRKSIVNTRYRFPTTRLKTTSSINSGLLALSNVITALYRQSVTKRPVFVPYRNSKLTRILKGVLSSSLLFIACVSVNTNDVPETINTLNYAARALSISITRKPVENFVPTRESVEIVRLKKEIAKLKEEIKGLRHGRDLKPTLSIEQVLAENARLLKEVSYYKNMHSKSITVNKTVKFHEGMSTKPSDVSPATVLYSYDISCSMVSVYKKNLLVGNRTNGSISVFDFLNIQQPLYLRYTLDSFKCTYFVVTDTEEILFSCRNILKKFSNGSVRVLHAFSAEIACLKLSGEKLAIGFLNCQIALFSLVTEKMLFKTDLSFAIESCQGIETLEFFQDSIFVCLNSTIFQLSCRSSENGFSLVLDDLCIEHRGRVTSLVPLSSFALLSTSMDMTIRIIDRFSNVRTIYTGIEILASDTYEEYLFTLDIHGILRKTKVNAEIDNLLFDGSSHSQSVSVKFVDYKSFTEKNTSTNLYHLRMVALDTDRVCIYSHLMFVVVAL